MAKRYQPPRDFARNIKKPKLDISINKGRPPPQQQQQLRTPCSPKDDFWDDGEDDVLLLATQVAETAASQKRGGVSEAVFSISESAELTFSEFAPNAAMSTQRPVQAAAKAMHQDILSQMFDDDDDFDLLAAEKLPSKKGTPAGRTKSEGENVFKKPALPVVAVARNANSMPENGGVKEIKATAPSAATEPEPEALSQSQARRQLASERQIKFLMDRLDALKKENLKLSTELDDSKSKIVTKEGEASLLRDELKHIKHQMHSLKMEKILSTESAKSESKSKIAELAKQVEAKKTELQLKAVECLQLKQQHAEVTQRFEMSMRNESMFMGDLAAPVAIPQPVPQKLTAKQKFEAKKRRLDLLKLRGLPQAQETTCSYASCMPEPKASSLLYKDSAERVRECGMGIMATVLQKQWRALRSTVAELQLAEKQSALSPMEAQECAKKIFSAATWTLNELSTLADSLPVQNCRVYPSHDYELLSDYSERQRVSLLQPQPLYDDEQAILMRRFFGALALLCRQYGFVAKAMFDCIREESCALEGEFFLLAAAKRICRIGYSTELVQHFGLLESFAALLHSLLLYALSREAKDPLSEEQQLQLAQLLKELIFTRPSVWLLRELSFCVGLCVRLPIILNFLCQHSESAAFRAEPVRSTCEFTKDSCVLQVYSSLLEIAFPLYEPIRAVHFELLTVICQNHLKFVHYCFTSPPKFIHEQLPCYDDDDEEGASSESASNESESNAFMMPANNLSTTATAGSTMTSNSVSSTLQSSSTNSTTTQSSVVPTANGTRGGISCECYNRLCLSVVTLVYQVLRHWLRTEQREQFTSQVGQISRIAVQVLHIIFCDNYLTSLFRDAEDTTKHYLHLICKWLEEQQQPLRFQAIHLNFLTKLQTSHIMPKHISVDANIANITADLTDWCRITNDSVDSSSSSNEDNLSLMESAFDESGFFEGLKGYAFNFQ